MQELNQQMLEGKIDAKQLEEQINATFNALDQAIEANSFNLRALQDKYNELIQQSKLQRYNNDVEGATESANQAKIIQEEIKLQEKQRQQIAEIADKIAELSQSYQKLKTGISQSASVQEQYANQLRTISALTTQLSSVKQQADEASKKGDQETFLRLQKKAEMLQSQIEKQQKLAAELENAPQATLSDLSQVSLETTDTSEFKNKVKEIEELYKQIKEIGDQTSSSAIQA